MPDLHPSENLLGTVRRKPNGTMLAVLWPSPPHPARRSRRRGRPLMPDIGEQIHCGNDHTRPVKAVARVSWPSGRYKATTACAGDLNDIVWEARREGWPILIEPIAGAKETTP